jgi:hypothetical protein
MGVATGAALAGAAVAGGAMAASSDSEEEFEGASKNADMQAMIAKKQWRRYREAFAPLEDKLIEEVQRPVARQPGFARMMGGIDRGYADLQAGLRRRMAGRYPQGSGLETLQARDLELSRTRDRAAATADWSAGRMQRMMQVAGLGRDLPQTAVSAAGSAASNMARVGQAKHRKKMDWWQMGLSSALKLYSGV